MAELKEVLAVVNNKGGVAKTTTVQNLAAGLMQRTPGTRVLVIDLDPQGNLSSLCGWTGQDRKSGKPTMFTAMQKEAPLPVYKSESGVYYAPSDPRLQDVDADLQRAMQPKRVLCECFGQDVDDHTGDGLTDVVSSFDYILVDCPPALSQTTYNAMAVATGLLVPVQMEGLSVNGLGSILSEMLRVQRGLNEQLTLKGILPVMVDARPNIVKGFLSLLKRDYDCVLSTKIRRCIKVTEAQTQCRDIFSYAPQCTAAHDYADLVSEIFPDE